jgi:hypothetical protein
MTSMRRSNPAIALWFAGVSRSGARGETVPVGNFLAERGRLAAFQFPSPNSQAISILSARAMAAIS